MPINLIKVQTYADIGQTPPADVSGTPVFVDTKHLNVNNGLLTHGGGIQDIARVLIASHHHVDPSLFVNGGRTYDGYGSHANDIHGASLADNLPSNIWTGLSDTGRFGDEDIYDIADSATSLESDPDFISLLNAVGYFLYFTSSTGVVDGSISVSGFTTNPLVNYDSNSPYHFFNPNGYLDHTNRSYQAAGVPSSGATQDRFGFTKYSVFAGPLYPTGILLSADVGGNKTFAQHVADSNIHFVKNTSSLPDVEVSVDSMWSHHSFLNIYDTSENYITIAQTYTYKRVSDDYLFNPLDEYDDNLLNQVPQNNKDIEHPVLYEEAVYMWHNQKLRQFKMIKADPDDIDLAEQRAEALPLDSLFVGANSRYDFLSKRNVKVIHDHLDTYYYENNYKRNENFEYDGDKKYTVAMHQNQGLGYGLRRGFSSGI